MKYACLTASPRVLGLVLGWTLAGTAGAAEPTAVAPPTRMDQVQREAVNPMRRIIEAATVVRTKVRVVEPGRPAPVAGAASGPAGSAAGLAAPAAPAAVAAAPSSTERRSALAPAASSGGASPPPANPGTVQINRTASTGQPIAEVVGSSSAAVASVPTGAAAAGPVQTAAALSAPRAEAAAGPGPGEAPLLLAVAAPAAGPSPAAQALARSTASSAESPQMLSMIEPVVPARLRSRLPPELRLRLDLTIDRDGSVRDVAVSGPVDRQLAPLVTAAVRQWRYAPLSEPRLHNVELLLNFTE